MLKRIFTKQSIITTLLILLLAILISIGAYFFITETIHDLKMKDQQYLSEIAQQNSNIVKRAVAMNLDKVEAIANIIGKQENVDTNYIVDILKLESARSSFKRMGFAFPNGDTVNSDDQTFNIFDRDYFKIALSGKSNVSDKLTDKVGGNDINVYAVPAYHKNEIIGVIFATSDTNNFANLLNTPTFGGEGFSYIITKEGAPVVFADNKNSFQKFTNLFDEIEVNDEADTEKMQENMKNEINGIVEFKRQNVIRVCAYNKVGVNDWYVVSVVPKFVISKSTDILVARNILIVFITVILFTLLMIFIIVQNRKSKHTLEKIAYYDELTNAPTLAKFKIEAQNFINANPNKNLLMVKFDIYQFKLINQILGNTVGDTVIKNIVNSLRINNPGKYQRYARLHDDEFLVLHIYEKLDDIAKIEEKFENIFYELMGKDFNYNIKIISGVYHMIYENCTNAVDAIEKANIAHRKAKQSGQDLYVYDKSLVQKLLYQKDIENNMQSALQKNEFKVFLQPKYELKSEKIVGAEALVRWQKPDGILVSPSEFIPIFENNGFITKLDMYMFEQVCKIIKVWIDLNLPVINISVNFSRNHLLNYNFINELIEISEKYHVPRKYIEIELTETVIFENEELIEAVLHKIHSAGFTFSMDDFGTGYSSLGLLKNLPVDVIKIDRSFFTNSKYIARANYVVESVMIMAKKLNIYTVAEGIEEIEQIDFLKKIGCDIVQGFYYAKPMPADDFYEFAKLNNKNK